MVRLLLTLLGLENKIDHLTGTACIRDEPDHGDADAAEDLPASQMTSAFNLGVTVPTDRDLEQMTLGSVPPEGSGLHATQG